MKLEEIRSQISSITGVYAFGVCSLNGEIVNLNIYGVEECNVDIILNYLNKNNIKFKYEVSSNKLNKSFIFTLGSDVKNQYLLNNKPTQKLYVSI